MMDKSLKTMLCVLIALSMSAIYGCNGKTKSAEAETDLVKKLLTSAKESGGAERETGESATEDPCSLVSAMESLDQKLFPVKNRHARVYSMKLSTVDRVVIAVVFNEDNPARNVRAFLDIMEATGEELARKYGQSGGGQYIAYAPDCSGVMMYYGETGEQVFNREGIRFLADEEDIPETGQSAYRGAYVEIIRQKRNKTRLSDWDYYMFRNRLPEPEGSEGLQCGPAVLGTSALIEVLRTDWNRLVELSSDPEDFIESFLAIPEEREAVATVLKTCAYGIVWFDTDGNRVMAEKLTKDEKTGKIEKERRWYNGYSMPGAGSGTIKPEKQ
jgi:hypothetical protein